jgi:Family of unknown function (DUF5317)
VFLLFVFIISLGVALARGGNLWALGQVRVCYSGVLLVALFFKAAVYSTVAMQYLGSGPWNRIGHVLVTLALLAVVFANRKLPGFWLVGLGIAANLLVILANGGAMPVSVVGAQRLGLPTDPLLFHQQYGAANILVSEGARLWFLGDVIVTPSFLPAKVISTGDAVLAIGAFIFFQKVLVGPRPTQTFDSPTAT